MIRHGQRLLLAAGITLFGATAVFADDKRSQFNYTMFCQGCHGPQGDGAGSVPKLRNFVGNFLQVEGGREFLVQVPGSANAALDDQSLAELLNWILVTFSAEQLPSEYLRYSAEEVGALRRNPVNDIRAVRNTLLSRIESGKRH